MKSNFVPIDVTSLLTLNLTLLWEHIYIADHWILYTYMLLSIKALGHVYLVCDLSVMYCIYTAIVSVVGACELVCQSVETSQLAVRNSTVIDGTPCYSETFDTAVCVSGVCVVSTFF